MVSYFIFLTIKYEIYKNTENVKGLNKNINNAKVIFDI